MRIVIPGSPIPQARHRLTTVGGFARQYDPQASLKKVTERLIKFIAGFKAPLSGPIDLSLTFCFAPPDSSTAAQKNESLWGLRYHTAGDFDNYAKFICDCANGILWIDDRQIVSAKIFKKFSKNACTIIDFEDIECGMTKDQINVFKIFSPDDLTELQVDMLRSADLFSDLVQHENMTAIDKAIISDRLTQFANAWVDKLKKIKVKNDG